MNQTTKTMNSSIEMVTLTKSGFEEILDLVQKGMSYEITKAIDGTDIVIVRNKTGASRIFTVILSEENYNEG